MLETEQRRGLLMKNTDWSWGRYILGSGYSDSWDCPVAELFYEFQSGTYADSIYQHFSSRCLFLCMDALVYCSETAV